MRRERWHRRSPCSATAPSLSSPRPWRVWKRAAAVDAAAALMRADLLAEERPLEFVHPLVRLAVYETIGLSERELAHARAAALLAETGAAAERLALELMRAPPGGA